MKTGNVAPGATVSTDQRILELVRLSDGLERAEVARLLGLPAPTVARAVGRLLRRGEVAESTGQVRGRAGRPPRLLRLTGATPVLGVLSWCDTGIRATLGTFGARSLADQAWTGPDAELDRAMGWIVRSVAPDHALVAVVVGVSAPFQPGVGSPRRQPAGDAGQSQPDAAADASSRSPKVPVRLDGDPAAEWSDRVGVPVYFVNDANLAALGELSAGAARGATDLVYLRVGADRVGAGLVIDGRLHRGASGFAGELAHIHVDDNGPLCSCGGRGCLSSRMAPTLLADIEDLYRRPMTFENVLLLADQGERAPQRVLEEIGRTVGRPLADLVTFLNPGLIVLDGGLGAAGRFVSTALRQQLDRYAAPPAAAAVEIRAGTLTDLADLHGAIAVCRAAAW